MKMREFRERLLVALVAAARSEGLGRFLDPQEISDACNLAREPGQLRLAVKDLEEQGYINPSYTLGGGEEGGLDLRLTARGIEEAEELLDLHPEYSQTFGGQAAPAADRYVRLSDNQKEEITDAVGEVLAAVQKANDLDDENRQIALSEIAAFEATIIQPRVSVHLIERFINTIIAWILKVIPKEIIGAVAEKLIEKLIPFLA